MEMNRMDRRCRDKSPNPPAWSRWNGGPQIPGESWTIRKG